MIAEQKLLHVSVSRIPDAMIDKLDEAITNLHNAYELDDDCMRIFEALLIGYGAAWDALDERENGEELKG